MRGAGRSRRGRERRGRPRPGRDSVRGRGAVDVSRSVDWGEAYLQREGYIRAFSDSRLLEAIAGGHHGRIAVTYAEWSGSGNFLQLVGWTVIDGAESAKDFVGLLSAAPMTGGRSTSISGALFSASSLYGTNGISGTRRVIDVSGDGANNNGANVGMYRDLVVQAGFVINGLPILTGDDGGGGSRLTDLDVYYRECVIGGPGSFVVVADGFESFGEAILRKLILEIADAAPPGGVEWVGPARLIRAQAPAGPFAPYLAQRKYAPACNIGELMRLRRQLERQQQQAPLPPPLVPIQP